MRTELILLCLMAGVIYFMMRNKTVKNEGTVATETTTQEEESTVKSETPATPKTELENIETDVGADLNSAFEPTLPAGTNPEVVEFKNDGLNMDAKSLLPAEGSKSLSNVPAKNLINVSKFVQGIDTQGSSNKNASWDLRCAPVNPKFKIGPWNNSTIDADKNCNNLFE
jgi:hypothetical protein